MINRASNVVKHFLIFAFHKEWTIIFEIDLNSLRLLTAYLWKLCVKEWQNYKKGGKCSDWSYSRLTARSDNIG